MFLPVDVRADAYFLLLVSVGAESCGLKRDSARHVLFFVFSTAVVSAEIEWGAQVS